MTRLNLMLLSRARGMPEAFASRKIAVPATRTGGSRFKSSRKSRTGFCSRSSRAMTEARPLCQVCISQKMMQPGHQRQPAAVLELGQIRQQEGDVDDEQQRQSGAQRTALLARSAT